jgi:O-antigen ligase
MNILFGNGYFEGMTISVVGEDGMSMNDIELSPHNTYIMAFGALGLIGFLAFIMFYGGVFRAITRSIKERLLADQWELLEINVGHLFALVFLSIHFFTIALFTMGYIWIFLGLALGTSMVYSRQIRW